MFLNQVGLQELRKAERHLFWLSLPLLASKETDSCTNTCVSCLEAEAALPGGVIAQNKNNLC